jgi:hypothetical protein
VQRPAGDDAGDLAVLEGARDDTTRTYGVYAGADDLNEILLERGNGDRQLIW